VAGRVAEGAAKIRNLASTSLRTRFLLVTVPAMLVLVVGSYFGFNLIINRIVDGLSERFAIQQVHFDRSRTLLPLLQEIALARKMARTPAIIDFARDEAEAANRAKSEFLAMMSHDLRTPLNAIIGFSDMIKSETFGPVDNDTYKAYVLDIHQSGHLLLSLINVLLDISKIEAGKMELVEITLDLPIFLRGLLRQIAPFADARGITVNFTEDAVLPALRCDRRSLAQIVNNLVSNAVKFSNSGQSVLVWTAVLASGELAITVEDHGIGMDTNDIKKALEPFAQVRSAEARNQEGTGLELHVSNLLMMAQGGQLDIESRLGVGTVVSAVFPPERIVAQASDAPSLPNASST
jgi:signal transduction histidine kinase